MSQNNLEKLKYITNPSTFEQPMFRYYTSEFNPVSSIVYGADGIIKNNVQPKTDTQYTRNVSVLDNKSTLSDNLNKKYYPSLNGGFTGKGDPNDYSNKINIENEFKLPQYNKFNQYPKFKSSDGRIFNLENDRRRNLDYSNYIQTGGMTNTGFGNIDELSKNKNGLSTRDVEMTIRDTEIDRFHFTFKNYQHEVYGSNPIPQDTRYLNKKNNLNKNV